MAITTTTTTTQSNDQSCRHSMCSLSSMYKVNTGDPLEASDSMEILSRVDLHSGSHVRSAISRCQEDQVMMCDPEFPYRMSDGSCNNLHHPTWGKANTCFARLLPPDYSDGQSAPRISVTGNPLPNPRILSAIVHRDFNYPATYTHFVMQYGQFFAHDIAFTPSSRTRKCFISHSPSLLHFFSDLTMTDSL
ncbi:Thyroid peroxidase, partial [Fragariocoptes setiger]